MTEDPVLLRRLERLEAVREIEALKARYAALADAKYTSAYQRVAELEWRRIASLQAECFTWNSAWDGGPEFGGTISGRAALAEWFASSPWRFAFHLYTAPRITLPDTDATVDQAAAEWRLWQVAIPLEAEEPILLAASTREEYRRADGAWLISRMRFTEIHRIDLAEIPTRLRCVIQRHR